MNQDEEHLKLLAIFHYVVAGMVALLACFPIIHLIAGIFILSAPEKMAGNQLPPIWFGLFFVVLASVMILGGWIMAATILYAGRCLVRRKKYTFCMVIAGVSCLFMPFGTILGVFTIIVLLRPTVKELFAATHP